MNKKTLLFALLTFLIGNPTFCQTIEEKTEQWPAFTFKVNLSANMYYGLKNESKNKRIKTPPAVGPELGFSAGLRINSKASVYTGVGLSLIPVFFGFETPPFNPTDKKDYAYDYFPALSIFSIPLSFEYTLPLKNKHHLLAEAGIVANYNSTYSYGLSYGFGEEAPSFYAEIYDNKELKWYPTGFFKIGYLKSFKKFGGFSTGLRFSFSGAVLGRGYYQFNGYETGNIEQGNLSLPVNAMSLDFVYHFRHVKKKN